MPENPEKSLNEQGINENELTDFWAEVKARLDGRTTSELYKQEILDKGGYQCSACGFTRPPRLMRKREGSWYCTVSCGIVKTYPR
jgi:hypothetical protein